MLVKGVPCVIEKIQLQMDFPQKRQQCRAMMFLDIGRNKL